MEDLTQRQKEILHLIREHTANSGFPPTRADICRAMGFKSPNAAEDHLRALERKGAIEMLPGASRGEEHVAGEDLLHDAGLGEIAHPDASSVLDEEGRLAQAEDAGSLMPDPFAVDCMTEAFYAMDFPKPQGGPATVRYHLELE